VAIAAAAVLVESSHWVNPLAAFCAFRIPSGGMCPTLCDGDRIIADLKAFQMNRPQRGDVAVFFFDREDALHIKRIVAVSGDEVVSAGGRLAVDSIPVELPTSACGTPGVRGASSDYASPKDMRLIVPSNRVYLVGDNLENSFDSRFYGTVDVSSLRGKALYIYWSSQRARIGCTVK